MMKRIAFILTTIITLFLIAFALQNRFLFGVPFVHIGTTSADLDHLLGKRYVRTNVIPPRYSPVPLSMTGRTYFIHFASYVFCDYDTTLFCRTADHSKDRVIIITWEKWMCWNASFLWAADQGLLHN
jgi:hypothetical protein